MARISVTARGGDHYRVEIDDGNGRSAHDVEAPAEEVERYGGGVPAEALIEASFGFLLEREPKESILRSFRLSVIERYFPDYAPEIARRLA
jgi:hypothetical protein